jgi:hypothetical protein
MMPAGVDCLDLARGYIKNISLHICAPRGHSFGNFFKVAHFPILRPTGYSYVNNKVVSV